MAVTSDISILALRALNGEGGGGGGTGDVTGVKGSEEVSYRKGNVNISPVNLGLGNVDNTSDEDKPISTAVQTALDGKVDKVEGKGLSENDYTDADKEKLSGLENYTLPAASASTLGGVKVGENLTINENGVLDGLMTSADKAKLEDIESGAQVNVQPDYAQTDTAADDYIKNKPTLGTAAAKDSTASVTENSTDLVESGAVYEGLAGKQDTLTFDSVPTDGSQNPVTSAGVKNAIDATVARVYKPAGNKAVADMVSGLLVAANLGNVYNMTDSGETTADFLEGAGKAIKEGDDVSIVDVGTAGSPVYKFNLLSGMVDLSGYQTRALPSEVEGQSSVEGALGALSTNKQPKTLSTPITVDGTERSTVEGALGAVNTLAAGNKTNIGTLANLNTAAKSDLVVAVNELAAKGGTILTGTLSASGWSGNAQTVNVTGMTAALNGVVGMMSSATAAQITAASAANIRATGQGAGTVTFACDMVPSVDIPFGVFVYK